MQTQNFAPAAGSTRTILLGRNRLNALAASFIPAPPKPKAESRAQAPRPSLSVRKVIGAPAGATVVTTLSGRI